MTLPARSWHPDRCILAMSRAIGEAAPILIMVEWTFVTFTPDNLMSGFAAMPLQIYDWLPAGYGVPAGRGLRHHRPDDPLLAFNAVAIIIRQLQKPLN